MIKRSILFMAIMLPTVMFGQVFRNVTVEKLDGMQPGDHKVAGLSRDGRYVLLTSMSGKGLERISLADGKKVTISELDGAGIQPLLSHDGQLVVHCTDTFGEDHLRRTSLSVTDLASGSTQTLAPPSRQLRGYRLTETHAEAVMEEGPLVRRKARQAAVDVAIEADDRPTVMSRDLQLQVVQGEQTRTLAPNGEGEDVSYLWASLSPNGQRIAYYVSNEGTYVCNLQGEDVQFIAHDCLAPQWYDDNTIVGMKERDDDLFIASSVIVAYTLDGCRQELTAPSQVMLFPYCSSEARRIVCSSGNGEVYVLNIEE